MFEKQHNKTSLRFRRWSRKSYAAFHSIGRHVTIGSLKNIVADTFLRKQTNTILPFCDEVALSCSEEEEEQEPPPNSLLLLWRMLLPIQAEPDFCALNKYILNNNNLMADSNSAIGHFYFKN